MSTTALSKHTYVPGLVSQKEHEEGVQWVYNFQKAADSLVVDDYVPVFFTDDAELNFADAPTVVGRDNLYQRFKQQFELLAGMKHHPVDIHVLPDRILQSCTITYSFGHCDNISLKAYAVWFKAPNETKARRAEFYGDWSKVGAAMQGSK